MRVPQLPEVSHVPLVHSSNGCHVPLAPTHHNIAPHSLKAGPKTHKSGECRVRNLCILRVVGSARGNESETIPPGAGLKTYAYLRFSAA